MSRKLDRMNPDELLAEARSSPQNASRVVQYLYSTSGHGKSTAVWQMLAEDPVTSAIPDVQVFTLRALGDIGASGRTYRVLMSLLQDRQPLKDKRAESELLTLVRRYMSSDFAPILMLASGTPPAVTNEIAVIYGMHSRADYNTFNLKMKLFRRMVELSRGMKWGNEQSGILLGKTLMANKNDPMAKDMVGKSLSYPSSFEHAVFEYGPRELVQEVIGNLEKGMTLDVAKALLNRLLNPPPGAAGIYHDEAMEMEEALKLTDMVMEGPMPGSQKAEFIRYCRRMDSNQENPVGKMNLVVERALYGYAYRTDDPELFRVAVEFLEEGEWNDLGKMVKNFDMSMVFADRIIAAARRLGMEDKLGPDIGAYMAVVGDDEDIGM